ncbi:hypothetical protein E4K72_02130 [Oxalobacteraceae bacterium OM1]|nr:hypothetical protein E4K72_02130 [Oxalobacteraceae bacterium OM1]
MKKTFAAALVSLLGLASAAFAQDTGGIRESTDPDKVRAVEQHAAELQSRQQSGSSGATSSASGATSDADADTGRAAKHHRKARKHHRGAAGSNSSGASGPSDSGTATQSGK